MGKVLVKHVDARGGNLKKADYLPKQGVAL